jgi:hypothetical protein
MGRIKWFVLGAVAGSGMTMASLKYHFLYTNGGLKAVPKQSATLSETFLDVRDFGASDWAEHEKVMAAVMSHDPAILESAAVNSIRDGLDRWVDRIEGETPR